MLVSSNRTCSSFQQTPCFTSDESVVVCCLLRQEQMIPFVECARDAFVAGTMLVSYTNQYTGRNQQHVTAVSRSGTDEYNESQCDTFRIL